MKYHHTPVTNSLEKISVSRVDELPLLLFTSKKTLLIYRLRKLFFVHKVTNRILFVIYKNH